MRILRAAEQVAYRFGSTQLYRGLNLDTTKPGLEKVHSILFPPGRAPLEHHSGWDHPEVAGHLLDYLDQRGLGGHWTTDPSQAERFASWPDEKTGQGGNLQAVVSAHWGGEGADPNRTNTREFSETGERIRSFPEEQEHALLPRTQVDVHGLKIRPYDNDYWNSPSDSSEEVDENHEGPWHQLPVQSSTRSAGLTPDDMDNLSWDWDKGKWVPRGDPEAPLIPKQREREFDHDRNWPGWRGASDYRGHHQAPGPGSGFPLHDLSGNEDLGGLPEDWYTHPQYYTHNEVSRPELRRTQQMYNRTRGNPEAPVNIYRALPQGYTSFNTGDWVTPSLEYARQHAMSEGDPDQDLPVIKSTVPAKHLWHNGDSYFEMGYHGPGHEGQVME